MSETPALVVDVSLARSMVEPLYRDLTLPTGENVMQHADGIASILREVRDDPELISAAYLFCVPSVIQNSGEWIEKSFGPAVNGLVQELGQVNELSRRARSENEEANTRHQVEAMRRMFLSMCKDLRVVLLKLASRLQTLRWFAASKREGAEKFGTETLDLYAPLANRLGIWQLKWELEDLSLRFTRPSEYREIAQQLDESREQRIEFMQSAVLRIRGLLEENGIKAEVSGRPKHIYSIWKKMQRKHLRFDQLFDVRAVRIIVDSVIDCYNCLGIIHDMFRPIPGRFKDYISTPKPNMYQSLHTTVIGKEGVPFEVQIRTWEMHYTAEYGIAAHWKYKLGMSGKDKFEERLAWIRQLLENQKDSENVEDIVQTIKSDLVPDDVFVFTPRGDVINLPTGATVIDFAYAIHSAVGNRMVGAKVDGRIVPLDYQVKTGEIVEVLTSAQPGKGPSRDWLKIVRTSEARGKIRAWYKKEKREENIIEGKAELEREFRRNNIRLADDALKEFLQKIADRQHCNSLEDFYAAIGYGGISVIRMMPSIKEAYYKLVKANQPPEVIITPPKKRVKSSEGVIVEGIDNCLIKFARCCSPLPGDQIIGFITRGHGVSIHKRDCTNVPQVIALCNEPERWINAYWDKNVKEEFKSSLLITCLDRVGLLADVSGQLANMHVMIHSMNTRELKDGRCTLTMTITVDGVEHMRSVMAKVSKIDGVLKVDRS